MNRRTPEQSNDSKDSRHLILLELLLALFLSTSVGGAAAERVDVIILFPEVQGNYAKIFSKITQGIEEHPRISANSLAVKEGTTAQEIQLLLEKTMAQAILVLGQRCYRLAKELDTDLPIIAGALVVPPSDFPSISMAGDPNEFFAHLRKLAPQVERISVVYSEQNSGWLIPLAETAARKHGLKLSAYPATNVRQAVHHFRTVLESAEKDTDAIWLPMDRLIPDKTVLPMALDAAWKRRLVVFSSNPAYVKRGALFALYPDHELMGRELAALAIKQINSDTELPAIPTRRLKLAVNQRTASHLGLHYSQSQSRDFDLIYPSPR